MPGRKMDADELETDADLVGPLLADNATPF
jgi:hypothetical protein